MSVTVDALTGRRLHGAGVAQPAARTRDPRLDFYRGIAMFIIFIAHTPGNAFSSWIPARWGFSDATEIFVFCSGMASAIAFGAVFDRAGWALGAVRVGFRVWQVYWAHIGLFVACATFLAAVDLWGGFDKEYIGTLNLWRFMEEPGPLLVGLMTLTYVPNYFDILPMYMVILVMIPGVMALARVHPAAVAVAVVAVWLGAQGTWWEAAGWSGLSFPAEPWSDRQWFFNPFGWQLVFFTGFALMRGWLPTPPVRGWLIALAVVVVVAAVPYSSVGYRYSSIDLGGQVVSGDGLSSKTDFAILRYVHFLALAYLAWWVVGPGGRRLQPMDDGAAARAWGGLVAVITKVGQQSLAVFLFSMFWARVTGFGLDIAGRDAVTVPLANILGCALIVLLAYGVGWVKSQPWRVPRDKGGSAVR
ncbi:OpgC family protein [Palleronia pelagia]|uniref:OpgC protein n=1 Tax=Palleronia pelagia TaxID=387096 RepID=A0A1H8INL1_9RHOB|nr:OpgC domain-containing protein [Palleronia pelagia]SEN69891.1 hypothetical protein SAMN04488011_105291 [Palleronia pelagia]